MNNEFSWERYQNGEKVQRRDGLEVLNVYQNDKHEDEFFKIAYVYKRKNNFIDINYTNEKGIFSADTPNADDDLIMAPRIQEFWIAIAKKPKVSPILDHIVHMTDYAFLSEKQAKSPERTECHYIVKVRINLDTGEQVE